MQTFTQFGLRIGNDYIPDPSSFEYTVSDLDLSAERDSNGTLHRDRVATKHNCKISYDALTYPIVKEILGLIADAEFSFSFIRPDTLQEYTGTYYVGDRTMKVINAWDEPCNWLCDLSFDLIEY
jgi:hypothetical protein